MTWVGLRICPLLWAVVTVPEVDFFGEMVDAAWRFPR